MQLKTIKFLLFLFFFIFWNNFSFAETTSTEIGTLQPKTASQKPEDVRVIKIGDAAQDIELKKIDAEWSIARNHLKNNDINNAIASLEKIKKLRKEASLQNLEYITAVLLRKVRILLTESRLNEAIYLSNIAIELSPDFYPAYYTQGKILWRNNKISAINSYITGFKTASTDFVHTFIRIGDFFIIGTAAFLLSIFIFFIITIIKYFPLLKHNLQEITDSPYLQPYLTFIPWLILLLPLLIFGLLIAFFMWTILLWLYLNNKERVIIFLFILFVAYSQTIFSHYSIFLTTREASALNAIIKIEKGYWNNEIYEELIETIKKDPTNKGAFYALGILDKNMKEYEKAIAHYQRATVIDPNFAKVYTNLGNIYFLQKDYERAIENYKKAIEKDNTLISAYFNLSQTYREMFNFVEGEKVFQSARVKNPDLINYYVDLTRNNPLQLIIDEGISFNDIFVQAFKYPENHEAYVPRIWNIFEKRIKIEDTIKYVIILCSLIFLLFLLKKSVPTAAYCRECGKVICPKCHRSLLYKGLCSQCLRTFAQFDGIVKKEQVEQLVTFNRFQKRDALIMRISSLIIPGTGHIYYGMTFKGFTYAFLFVFSIIYLLLGNKMIYADNFFYYESDIIHKTSIFVFLIIIYSLSFYKIYKIKNRG